MIRRDFCIEKIPGFFCLSPGQCGFGYTKTSGSLIFPVNRRQVSWALQSALDTPEGAGCFQHVLETGMLDPSGAAPHAGSVQPQIHNNGQRHQETLEGICLLFTAYLGKLCLFVVMFITKAKPPHFLFLLFKSFVIETHVAAGQNLL